MKTIKVVVERWLEVPDEWDLVEPEHTGQLHLKTDNFFAIPELTWLTLKDHSEETCGWEEIVGEDKDSLGNMMVAGSSSLEDEIDEDEIDEDEIDEDKVDE